MNLPWKVVCTLAGYNVDEVYATFASFGLINDDSRRTSASLLAVSQYAGQLNSFLYSCDFLLPDGVPSRLRFEISPQGASAEFRIANRHLPLPPDHDLCAAATRTLTVFRGPPQSLGAGRCGQEVTSGHMHPLQHQSIFSI